jgi:hypothetical protein
MINNKEGSNTELQGKHSSGRPRSKLKPLVRKYVLQNDGRTEMEEKELWKRQEGGATWLWDLPVWSVNICTVWAETEEKQFWKDR